MGCEKRGLGPKEESGVKQRFRLFPLMMSLLLLAGCAAGGGQEKQTGEELALALQKEFGGMTACAGRFALTADYGERAFECVIDATYDRVTGGTLRLVEPELVQGVTATVNAEGTALSYDGFSLETGPLTDEGVSPMEALPTLWRQVAQGYVAAVEEGKGTLAVTYRPDGQSPGTGLEAVVAFDTESRKPATGELFWDGSRVVAVTVQEFEMMGEGQNGTGTNEDVGGN